MRHRPFHQDLRSRLARVAAWYRRLSAAGKVDIFGAACVWAAAIVILADRTLNGGDLMGDLQMPALAMGGLAIGSGWRAIERIRQPEDAPRAELPPREKMWVYGLVAAWMIIPVVLACLGGWIAFEVTAGAPVDARRFWLGVTVGGIFIVGNLAPMAWLVCQAWRAHREAEKIAARIEAMDLDEGE